MYHGSPAQHASKIATVGLLPQVGDNTKDAQGCDGEAHVCLTTSKKIAKGYAGQDGTVFAVDTDHPHLSGTRLKPDAHEKSSVKLNVRVPPAALSVAESSDISTIQDKHGNSYDVRHRVTMNGKHEYSIHPPGTGHLGYAGIGQCTVSGNMSRMMHVSIDPEHQRKGLATALYNHAEKHLGVKLRPNEYQSDEGKAYWKSRQSTAESTLATRFKQAVVRLNSTRA